MMKTKLFNISGKPDALRQNARRFAIIFSVILTLGFASCPTEDDDSTNSNNTDGAKLKINNQSFTEITDVIWQNVTFANNEYENSIKSGTNVTQNVETGGGYIFFKRKTNPITARTREIIIAAQGETVEFTFTDNTLIVETNNTDNSGTLSSLQNTVVWWDDAEGEMQPYYEAQHFVGYYKNSSDLFSHHGYTIYYHTPKNGQKSIAVGGTNTAKLHLRINLIKAAKLSFWFANKNSNTAGTIFSINGERLQTWTTDTNWAKREYELAAGQNDIVWEKKDGGPSSGPIHTYFSLDDILIYYTE
jgi:hypothetical protein